MDFVLLLARLVLIGVFLTSGLTKVIDRAGSRQALVDFGVPRSLATPISAILPLAELVVAVSLLFSSSAWWGAVGALALLLAFTAGITYNLARGRRPDCHCFGQLHSEPVGPRTLVRNGVLAAVASLVALEGQSNLGPGVFDWLPAMTPGERLALLAGLILGVLLLAQWWFSYQLLRQNGRLLMRLEVIEEHFGIDGAALVDERMNGLPAGSPAPAFALSSLTGGVVTLSALLQSDKPVLLIFTDPNCGPCGALLPDVERWQREFSEQLTIAIISRGTVEENRSKIAGRGLTNVLLQSDWEVYNSYQAAGTPSAVIIQPDGTIGSGLAAGGDRIGDLVARTLGLGPTVAPTAQAPLVEAVTGESSGQNGHTAPSIGQPSPDFELHDLEGRPTRLSDFRGTDTLVLFWSPTCGFCQRMLPELRRWEAKPQDGQPRLLVISTGTAQASLEQGIRSKVVLDHDVGVGEKFGAHGTPTAILVSAEGTIASDVAVGAQEVLALARSRVRPVLSQTAAEV